MTVRRHWISLVHPMPLIFGAVAIFLAWVAGHPREVVASIHLTRDSQWYPWVHLFYLKWGVFVGLAAFLGVLCAFGAWAEWSITYYQVDRYGLKYRIGFFRENILPTLGVGDMEKDRDLMGMIFGYGSISTISGGRVIERLTYVPRINEFMEVLQAGVLR